MRLPFLALALALMTSQASGEPTLRAVTLSTAGLAVVEADARLGADPVQIAVRRGDVDDFLKSFWLDDPAGAVARITLTGEGGFGDAFDLLPLDPDDVKDPARLLNAMIGAPLVVERGQRELSGVNMGVVQRTCGDSTCDMLALRRNDGGIAQIQLGDGIDFRLEDAADRDVLDRALSAWRGTSNPNVIDVSIATDDPDGRDGRLIWLQSTPVWQTAYRAVDGADGLRLVGWAVVENATGHDWDNVELTLATGAVRAIEVQLYARRIAQRERAADQFMEMPMADFARMSVGAMAEAPEAAATRTDDGASFSRYTLEVPVSLKAGDMISLPFMSEVMTESRLLLYRGMEGASHPKLALEITNPLPLRLPAGVLTLYEDGRGHAGDALIPEMAPGSRTVVEFADDRSVTVRESADRIDRVREMRLVAGILTVREDLERRTSYRVEGAADRDRRLTIEHPRRDGWDLLRPDPSRTGLDAWRFVMDVKASEIAELVVTERQPRERRVELLALDVDGLSQWVRLAPDAASRDLLATLQGLRRQQADMARRIDRLAEREQALVEEQSRLVEVIVALGDSSAANADRRVRVDEIDVEIARARDERAALQDMAEQLDRQVDDLLAG